MADGRIFTPFFSTTNLLADVFTKAIGRSRLQTIKMVLMVHTYHQLEGEE